MKRIPTVFLFFLLSLLIVACDGSQKAKNTKNSVPSLKAKVATVDLTDDIWDGHAISYGGFREGQRPGGASPSDIEILEDMKILEKNWNLIRFYNSNEHGEAVLRVITENNIDLKVMLGIYIFQTKGISGDELAANETLNRFFISEGLRLAKTYPDIIAGINIGNEVLVSWSFVPNEVETIIGYVQQVSDGLDAAGLDIPLTVADNYGFWESADAITLASKLDFITVHGYAMWDGFGIADALAFLEEHFAAVKKNLPGKPIIVGETGWATYAEDAQIYGQIGAEANEVNAEIYFHRISAWAETQGITTILFEAFDEPWKSEGVPGAAEGHWGVFDANRKAKLVMHPFYPELVTDVPTSPDYTGFVFTPAVNVGLAFRASAATDLAINSTAEALDSCSLSESSTAYEGSKSLMFYHDGTAKGGFFSLFAPPLNIDRDNVVFALSGVPSEAEYFELKFEGGGGHHTVNILSYTPISDGIWDIYTLPLNDFGSVDFHQVNAIGFWHPFSHATHKEDLGHYVPAHILIDDIHFK